MGFHWWYLHTQHQPQDNSSLLLHPPVASLQAVQATHFSGLSTTPACVALALFCHLGVCCLGDYARTGQCGAEGWPFGGISQQPHKPSCSYHYPDFAVLEIPVGFYPVFPSAVAGAAGQRRGRGAAGAGAADQCKPLSLYKLLPQGLLGY